MCASLLASYRTRLRDPTAGLTADRVPQLSMVMWLPPDWLAGIMEMTGTWPVGTSLIVDTVAGLIPIG